MTDIFPSVPPEDKAETAERQRKELEAFANPEGTAAERAARMMEESGKGFVATRHTNGIPAVVVGDFSDMDNLTDEEKRKWLEVDWCRDEP